jgi:hypothetical protein
MLHGLLLVCLYLNFVGFSFDLACFSEIDTPRGVCVAQVVHLQIEIS